MTMGERWHRLGCLGQLLFVPFAMLLVMVVSIKVGQPLGLVERGNGSYVAPAPRPTFSRKACLREISYRRYQRNYGELTDDEGSIVARECVALQSAIERW